MSYTPDPEEVRDEIEESEGDISDDTWEEMLDKYGEKFGDHGEDGFVAWAAAYVEFGIKIDADYALPGGGSGGGSGVPDDVEWIPLADKESVGEDEQVEVHGIVLGSWDGTTSKGKPKTTVRLMDESTVENLTAYGESSVKNLDAADLETGEYVHISGVQAFSFEPDDADEEIFKFSVTPWADFSFDNPEIEVEDISKDRFDDIVSVGDFVHVEGMVTDTSFNEYEGCANCMTKYDPDDVRVCPNCGGEEMKTYTPGRVSVTEGGETATLSFSPSDHVPDGLEFGSEVRAFGEYSSEEYDETEYKQVEVVFCEITEEMDSLLDMDDDTVDDKVEEVEQTELDEVDEDTNGEVPEEIEEIEEKVLGFPSEMPAVSAVRVLEKEFGIEDPDDQIEMMTRLRDLETVSVSEDESEGQTIEEQDWNNVMLEEA